MKPLHERLLLSAAILLLPGLMVVVGILPSIQRIQALRERIRTLDAECTELPRFSALTQAERQRMEDPKALWRHRLRVVSGDQSRLLHYHQVVSAWEGSLREAGLKALGMRSSWDPIHASFTVPADLAGLPLQSEGTRDDPRLRMRGWVLETEVGGGTRALFQALEASGRVQPLMEPVGLRWEASSQGRTQHLLLRNLVLVPQ